MILDSDTKTQRAITLSYILIKSIVEKYEYQLYVVCTYCGSGLSLGFRHCQQLSNHRCCSVFSPCLLLFCPSKKPVQVVSTHHLLLGMQIQPIKLQKLTPMTTYVPFTNTGHISSLNSAENLILNPKVNTPPPPNKMTSWVSKT